MQNKKIRKVEFGYETYGTFIHKDNFSAAIPLFSFLLYYCMRVLCAFAVFGVHENKQINIRNKNKIMHSRKSTPRIWILKKHIKTSLYLSTSQRLYLFLSIYMFVYQSICSKYLSIKLFIYLSNLPSISFLYIRCKISFL